MRGGDKPTSSARGESTVRRGGSVEKIVISDDFFDEGSRKGDSRRGSADGSTSPTHIPPGGSTPARSSFLAQVAIVFLLYAVQGIPAGYTENFLPLVMYSTGGAQLREVGWVGALSGPWLLKFLWAPFVDRYSTKRVWIVATHCVMLAMCVLCATETAVAEGVLPTAMVVYLLLLITATGVEDCAVDGYAMQILREIEGPSDGGEGGVSPRPEWGTVEGGESCDSCLGVSHARMLALLNAAQVVGFKLGHLYSGAPVWAVHTSMGHQATWLFLAAPIAAAAVLSYFCVPSSPQREGAGEEHPEGGGSPPAGSSLLQTFLQATGQLRSSAMLKLMFAAVLYKAGEKVIMPMYKPYLVDTGVSAETVGYWIGTYGTVSSAVGSILGAVLIDRMDVRRAARVSIVVRATLFLASVVFDLGWVSVVLQGLGSGLVTPVMFGYFMKSVANSPHRVTAYTLLQTCDDSSRFIGYTISGHVVELLGYRMAFIACCGLLVVPVGLL